MLGSEQEPTCCENSPAMPPGVCLMVGSDALFVIALSQVPPPGFAWHVFILPISFPWAMLAALFPFLLCSPACLLLYFMLLLKCFHLCLPLHLPLSPFIPYTSVWTVLLLLIVSSVSCFPSRRADFEDGDIKE